MKRFELVFNIISIFVDSLMLFFAITLAYFLRYRVNLPQYPIVFDLEYSVLLKNALIAIPFFLLILSLYGLYNLKSTRSYIKESIKVSAGVSTALMVFVAIYFFNPQIFPSRLIVLITWIFAIILVSLGRLLLLILERFFLKHGLGLHKLVLIASENRDFGFEKLISTRPELGYKIIKILKEEQGLIEDLDNIHKNEKIDEIIQANLNLDKKTNEALLKFTHDAGIKFHYLPDIIESQRTNIGVENIGGIPLIELKNTPLEGWGRVVKRTFDLVMSALVLIILSPVFLIVSLVIKLDSPGKILYIQERFGEGKPFKFYKFRSMYQDLSVGESYGGAEAEKVRNQLWKNNVRHGPFLKIKDDPRVTRFGKFIRRTKLDELPQLLNVLKGEMSLVGPRAHVLDEVNRYKQNYKRQFTIKPGITGLTQITQAKTPDLPFEEEMRLDIFYLENWSLTLDLSILFKTFLVLLNTSKEKKDY